MRTIEGFVCTARTQQPVKQEMLYGPNTGGSDFNHQRLTSNGLIPFSEYEDATEGLDGLIIRKANLSLTHIGIARIRMEITSTDEEWAQLQGHKNYIVVAEIDFGYLLLGRKVAYVPGVAYAPVSELELNGFRTIDNFDLLTRSWGIVAEVRRQGRPYTSQIATFEMQRLKLPF